MKMILVEPGKQPKVIDVDHSLEMMQSLVGGLIEYVPMYDDIDVVVNEEGKLIGLPLNRYILHGNDVVDVLCGNILLTTCDDEGETIGLSQEQIDKYLHVFDDMFLFI